jgi:hypothetical protein
LLRDGGPAIGVDARAACGQSAVGDSTPARFRSHEARSPSTLTVVVRELRAQCAEPRDARRIDPHRGLNDSMVGSSLDAKSGVSHDGEHARVVRQDLEYQTIDSASCRFVGELLQQARRDPMRLKIVSHGKRNLSSARTNPSDRSSREQRPARKRRRLRR